MKKRGSLELGVNSIVILIIAMAVLGLIIYFIYENFNVEPIKFPPASPRPADASAPITTSPDPLNVQAKEKSIGVRLNVFNTKEKDSKDTQLSMKCKGMGTQDFNVDVLAGSKNIEANKYVEYEAVLNFPAKPKDKYLCVISAKGTVDSQETIVAEKDFVVEIY